MKSKRPYKTKTILSSLLKKELPRLFELIEIEAELDYYDKEKESVVGFVNKKTKQMLKKQILLTYNEVSKSIYDRMNK